MIRFRILILVMLYSSHLLAATPPGTPSPSEPAVNETVFVHIIPHSHDDSGWLDTYEGYYQKQVSRILTGVVYYLEGHPEKRFTWANTSFFERWYRTQQTIVKDKVKKLIANGQLEFVGGGWVLTDEATVDFQSHIENLDTGLRYLRDTLDDVRPRIGWQLDPFGLSAVVPSVLAKYGFDSHVIMRIGTTHEMRLEEPGDLEFVWKGHDVDPQMDDYKLFTHVLQRNRYGPPYEFTFDADIARYSPKKIYCSKNAVAYSKRDDCL